jgi:hypothetical protein
MRSAFATGRHIQAFVGGELAFNLPQRIRPDGRAGLGQQYRCRNMKRPSRHLFASRNDAKNGGGLSGVEIGRAAWNNDHVGLADGECGGL